MQKYQLIIVYFCIINNPIMELKIFNNSDKISKYSKIPLFFPTKPFANYFVLNISCRYDDGTYWWDV